MELVGTASVGSHWRWPRCVTAGSPLCGQVLLSATLLAWAGNGVGILAIPITFWVHVIVVLRCYVNRAAEVP